MQQNNRSKNSSRRNKAPIHGVAKNANAVPKKIPKNVMLAQGKIVTAFQSNTTTPPPSSVSLTSAAQNPISSSSKAISTILSTSSALLPATSGPKVNFVPSGPFNPWPAMTPYKPGPDEARNRGIRLRIKLLKKVLSVGLRRFVERVTGSPIAWHEYDEQYDLYIIRSWVEKDPRFFPATPQSDALAVINWTRYMRNGKCHTSLRRIGKWHRNYLSAAAYIASQDMINYPTAQEEANKILRDLALVPLPVSQLPLF